MNSIPCSLSRWLCVLATICFWCERWFMPNECNLYVYTFVYIDHIYVYHFHLSYNSNSLTYHHNNFIIKCTSLHSWNHWRYTPPPRRRPPPSMAPAGPPAPALTPAPASGPSSMLPPVMYQSMQGYQGSLPLGGQTKLDDFGVGGGCW